MTRAITDAELLVYGATSTSSGADFAVPGNDIVSLSVSERAGREVAKGTIRIDTAGGTYTNVSATRIDLDDKLVIRTAWTDDAGGNAFGTGPFGESAFASASWRTIGTAIVTGGEVIETATNRLLLSLDIENFVFNRLRERIVNEYRQLDAPISGSEDAHLDTILREFVPDIDRTQLPTISDSIDFSVDKKRANKVIDELAGVAHGQTNEAWILGSDGEALTMESLSDLSALWTADEGQEDFEGDISHQWTADELMNEIRVEGGVDPGNIDDEQTAQTSSTTVTDSTRLTTRVDSRKSELPRIDVYAIENSGSDDALRVRLQADDGGGNPVEPSNTDSDIINQREDVPSGQDGFLTFQLGEHTIAPRDRPHLILDSPGSDGQTVGTDSGDVPAYKAFFSKPVITRLPDQPSQDDYRVHDGFLEDENLRSFGAARRAGQARLDRQAQPRQEFSRDAASKRAHELDIGEVVTLSYPEWRATGDYIVTEISHTYEGNLLATSLTLRSTAEFA